MRDRLERLVVSTLIRLFGAALFLGAPLPVVFAVCADIAQIDADAHPARKAAAAAQALVN